MANIRKHKNKIIILSLLIIGIYIFFSTSIFAAYFSINGSITTVTERLTFINYFSLGVAQIFSLLIVPVTTIILLNIKEIELEKRYLISRILVAISIPIILINLVLFNFLYWFYAIFFYIELLVWGPYIGFAAVYLVEFLLSLTIFLLMRVKSEES